ncbi:ATP-binding cassette subfamily B protein [Asanoa ferruginea]|uniref:Fatty acid ABC transporter ATP-binding/permease protein n=1 Tax=Asanoa ferruginea TaxID=53367 RepID=A0A3D9ZR44_9ACTN|nr:ATP-binding cassette subfamily B protein [Asanoa ferruginea]GIF49283.1 multidrug ABC transporter ATP-binding protein [Asanoa ferruginea]
MTAPQNGNSNPAPNQANPPAAEDGARVVPARLPAAGARRPGGGPPWMSAGMPVEKSMTFVPSAKRLLRRLSPYRGQLSLVVLLAISSVALAVIGPKILGHATDVIFRGVLGRRLPEGASLDQAAAAARAGGQENFAELLLKTKPIPGVGINFEQLGQILLVVLAIYVVSSLLAWAQGWVLNGVVQRAVLKLRADVEDKLNRLPLPYFDKQPRGELLSRVTNDIDNVAQSLQQTLSQVLTSLLTVVGVVTLMVWISPLLAAVALVAVPLSFLITAQIGKRSQKQFIAQWKHTGRLNGHIEEAFTGHELVKVFGRRKEVEADFETKNDELYKAAFGAQFVSGIIMPAMFFVGNLSYVVIAVLGGLRVASGTMTLGDVQAFIQYSRQFTQPLTQLASMANLLQSGVASAERVFDLLDADEQLPDPSPAVEVHQPHGRVEFEHVSFRYTPDTPLIDDLSLVAEPGHTVAIVGPTGAGKTTLVNLVMRFYELDGGRITLDGVDITTMKRETLRGEIGMVLQDTWLFGGTIRDNIAYGNPSATEEQIHAAAEATFVDRFVRSLPDGYDTVIDEEGSNVSAGERQLITIARAFLANPSLLILDEATSSVDTRTEALLQRAMAALRSDRTSFVIAHRLSTIRDAHLILVMEKGRIVEQGTHEQLLMANGAYRRLHDAQFTQAAVDLDGSAAPAGGIALAGAPPRG